MTRLTDFSASLAALTPVALADVLSEAALQDRVDRKYLVRLPQALDLLDLLGGGFRVLQIEQRRLAAYSTVYFDTPDLTCHRAHLQGRRRRWKARTRRYLDGDLCRLELKTKGVRGRTVKSALDVGADHHGRLDDRGRAFLTDALSTAYGQALPAGLGPVLDVRYRRATLVGDGQRLTLDVDLLVLGPDGQPVAGLQPDAVLVETKAGAAPAPPTGRSGASGCGRAASASTAPGRPCPGPTCPPRRCDRCCGGGSTTRPATSSSRPDPPGGWAPSRRGMIVR